MTSHDVSYSFSPAAWQLLTPAHLGEAGLVAVFDHADEVGGSGRHKLGPERPHDRVQKQGTVGKQRHRWSEPSHSFFPSQYFYLTLKAAQKDHKQS